MSAGLTVPAGLTVVDRETFWAAVMAEKRNVHPSPERYATHWMIVGTRERWGWASTGYMNSRDRAVYALARVP